MAAARKKFYVVWKGREPGVYGSWAECEAQTKGFDQAAFKSFSTCREAQQAFSEGSPEKYIFRKTAGHSISAIENPPTYRHDTVLPLPPEVSAKAWAVDAACSGNPGPMEYRGIDLSTGQVIFHYGPIWGTNNIGEFLAIVHAVALLTQQQQIRTIYSDSRNALLWYRAGHCKTKLSSNHKSAEALDMIKRAENWLQTHAHGQIPVLKWETSQWGEIPADFGRK